MKAIIRFCIVLLFSAVSLAQSNARLLLPEGYSVQTSFSDVSNIGFSNPSFLSRFNGISAGLSYQYGFKIEKPYGSTVEEYFDGFFGKSVVNGLPYSAALAYQSGDFHVAAAISQRYNLLLQSTKGIGINIINPDGTRKAVNITVESDIHDYSVLSSYRIGSSPEGNSLSLGLRLSLGVLKYYSHYDAVLPFPGIKFSMNSMAFALGADYKLAFSKGDLSIGTYFDKGLNLKGDVPIEQLGRSKMILKVDSRTPDAFRLDFLLNLPKVQVTADISNIFWHLIDQNFKNNLDFSVGISYKALDMMSVSLGAFMTDKKYVYDGFNQPDNNALFLTLGTDIAIRNYTFGISVSDSHMTSADARKQTIGRLTLGYQF